MSEPTTQIGKVQACGCIALPEEIQAQTGLYPGATFTIEPADDGSAITLQILKPTQSSEPGLAASCR